MVYRKHRTSTTSTIETSTNVEDSVSVDNEEEKENSNELWTPEMELTFLHAITKFKPVGIHKHFRMINLQRYFNSNSSKKLSTQELWNKFTELYNQEALDEQANRYNQEVLEAQAAKKRKTVLSPIQTDITEFVLPSEEFDALISEQRKATSPASTSPSHSSETTEVTSPPPITTSNTTTATTTTTTTTTLKKNRGRSSRASVAQNEEKSSKAQSPYTSGSRRTTRARAINSPSLKKKK